jgi:hypothetical protein
MQGMRSLPGNQMKFFPERSLIKASYYSVTSDFYNEFVIFTYAYGNHKVTFINRKKEEMAEGKVWLVAFQAMHGFAGQLPAFICLL